MSAAHDPLANPWTCPACALLCQADAPDALTCARREAWLAATTVAPVGCLHGTQALERSAAVRLAAQWLSQARQPLVAGLETDVDGARALQPLADAVGAAVDGGPALAQALRAQQDRGGFTTTLAEVRERADLLLLVGSWPMQRAPRLRERLHGGPVAAPRWLALGAPPHAGESDIERIEAPSLFSALASLAALLDGRRLAQPVPAAWAALAESLRAARYAVLVYEPAELGPQAGLLIERLHALVHLLNRQGRAAALPLGGSAAATVQQVMAWRTGLPLQSRRGPAGREHDPLTLDGAAWLAEGSTDLLLWLGAHGAPAPAVSRGVRRIVLGPQAPAGADADTLFLPVGTPGLDQAGHLHRSDGVVVLPLRALRPPTQPSVAQVLGDIHGALAA